MGQRHAWNMAWLDAVVHGLVQGMQGFQVVVSRRGVVKIESSPWKVCLMLCWLSEWKQRYRVRIARPSGQGRCEGCRSVARRYNADATLSRENCSTVRPRKIGVESVRRGMFWGSKERIHRLLFSQLSCQSVSQCGCVLQNPMLTRIGVVNEAVHLHVLTGELSADY